MSTVISMMADITACVARQENTITGLSKLTGYHRNSVTRYLKALHAEGLVTFEARKLADGYGVSHVWRWVQ